MNRNYRALELNKILQMLANEASAKDTIKLAQDIEPVFDLDEIESKLQETDDALVLSAKFGAPSFYGLQNVNNQVARAQAGGSLNMQELLNVAATLRTVRSLKQWKSKNESMSTALDRHFFLLIPNKPLEERIYTCILSEDEMSDNASAALSSIRKKIKKTSLELRERLDRIVRSQNNQKYLQDNIITMRSGRFVVPVKAEHKNDIPGLVHDTSSTGSTVFIEPMAVVEANNEIRVLQSDERDEINRILDELSADVGEVAEMLLESYSSVIQLDLIFAKANLAYKMRATKPKLNHEGRMLLKRARHPLISKENVVPTNISIGIEFDSLIITGPNTGGKTVALKTLGLLTLMTMCGLLIPADDGSEVSSFKHILADIGDEQSIEQSLSTFSSHMTNIIKILEIADPKSLVLMDELGAGTDPVEGAALATSIIEELRAKGAKLACTTHYAELKAYALKTEGVENGCCEFDVASLCPTYRLLIGVPGKSNAFEISTRLGMQKIVVDRARTLVTEDSNAFEEVVAKLEQSRKMMEEDAELARKERMKAHDQARSAKNVFSDAEKKAQKELDRARDEAQRIIAMTRARADAMISELEEYKKAKNRDLTAEQKASLRLGLREMEDATSPVQNRKQEDYRLPRPLKVGDDVLIFDIDKKAVVLEIPKDKHVYVQAGIIKTRVLLSNLRLLEQPQEKQRQRGVRKMTKSTVMPERITTEIDVRGRNVEEALMEIDSGLDRAVMSGMGQVTIIHGKGTGVLRSAVGQHLRRAPHVRSHRLGTYGEGENGVTIVELK